MPRRILALIVPSGSWSASAISACVIPPKNAISMACRCSPGRPLTAERTAAKSSWLSALWVDGANARDAQRPVKRRAERHVERRRLAPDLQECVLDHFLRLVRVAQDSDGGGEESAGRLVVEFRQCLPVLPGDALKQLRQGLLSRLSVQHSFEAPSAAEGRTSIGMTQV